MPPPAKVAYTNGNKGFTLAEVLITLGIIGVVASLTIPSLISNYKNKTIETQFKRAYSNIYNAIRIIESRDGTLPQCYYTKMNADNPFKFSQCADFYDNLTKEMHVIKICKGNAYNDGCIPKYQGVNTIKEYEEHDDIITGCSGYSQNNILNKNWAFVFNDGSILFTYDTVSNNYNNWSGVFAIDVNGKRGPNKWGYDIFSFAFNETKPGIIQMQPVCQLIEKGGRHSNNLLINISK